MELVGDDDEGLAVGLHVAHDGEQLVRLLRGQHGGGLVQDQNIGTAVQHLDDLHGLLLGNRHIIDLHVRVDIEAVLITDVLDLLTCIVQVKLALQAEDDILGGGEQIDQLEVLVDHADTQIEGILGRCDGHRLVVDVDLPLVGEIDAGEHVHQRGLAAAVFAQQGQDLALVQVKIHILIGDDLAAEPLGDVLHFDRAFLFQGCHPFFRRRWLQTPRRTPGINSIRLILPYMSSVVNQNQQKICQVYTKNVRLHKKESFSLCKSSKRVQEGKSKRWTACAVHLVVA